MVAKLVVFAEVVVDGWRKDRKVRALPGGRQEGLLYSGHLVSTRLLHSESAPSYHGRQAAFDAAETFLPGAPRGVSAWPDFCLRLGDPTSSPFEAVPSVPEGRRRVASHSPTGGQVAGEWTGRVSSPWP